MVLTQDKQNFDLALKFLKDANIKYYTYDSLDKVPVKIVLQGLHDYVDSGDDEIPELSFIEEKSLLPSF